MTLSLNLVLGNLMGEETYFSLLPFICSSPNRVNIFPQCSDCAWYSPPDCARSHGPGHGPWVWAPGPQLLKIAPLSNIMQKFPTHVDFTEGF